jgi:hypothetical protein
MFLLVTHVTFFVLYFGFSFEKNHFFLEPKVNPAKTHFKDPLHHFWVFVIRIDQSLANVLL